MDIWQGRTHGVAERFSCPYYKSRFWNKEPLLTADLSTIAGKSSVFPLWRVLAFLGWSIPLCFSSHKYSSFSEIHQNALQDICVNPNIPPGSEQCPFGGRNCSISVPMDLTTIKSHFHPFLPLTFSPGKGTIPLSPLRTFSLQPGITCIAREGVSLEIMKTLLYFPSTPQGELNTDYF